MTTADKSSVIQKHADFQTKFLIPGLKFIEFAIGPQYYYEITYYSNCVNNNYYCPYWTTAFSHWIGFAMKSRILFVDENFVIIGALQWPVGHVRLKLQ